MKPVCCMCGKEIKSNEHYFVLRYKDLCLKCGKEIRKRRYGKSGNSTGNNSDNIPDLR